MYDFDLHVRFLKSATEAWFNYASASAAAFGAMQDRMSGEPKASAPAPLDPFGWWTVMMTGKTAAPAPQPPVNMFDPFGFFSTARPGFAMFAGPGRDFGASAFQFASTPFGSFSAPMFGQPRASAYGPFAPMIEAWSAFAPTPQQVMPTAKGWVDIMQAWSWAMPQTSWGLYQMPMTAWLMSQGMPYAVAMPTAKANTASMDAAEAVREGFERAMSSFRTDGGHAVTPVSMLPTAMLALMAPWLALPPVTVSGTTFG